jgi:CheY-like chemotaxis protein
MILIAEDDKLNKLLLERVVTKLGYSIKSVEDGKELITICEKQKFKIIIVDVSMPLIDGIEAIDFIRNKPNCNNKSVIILMSGTYPQNFKELQEKYQIADIILKPFTLEDISKKIVGIYKLD